MPDDDLGLFDVVEECGGSVVLDGTESGPRTFPRPYNRERVQSDAMGELVAAYLDGIPDIFQRPNSSLFAWLKCELPRSGARGIVIRHYVWCDLWRAEVPRLAEQAGVPMLHLDVEGGEQCWRRTETRVRAFIEMLAGAS
jgi:benzoyl-CoA reductase/2-hydroxyglutaryl-CoA dehydratase subunit BcrC/BadD/HgdB